MSHLIEIYPFVLQLLISICSTGILSKTVFWFGADKTSGIQKYHFNFVSRLGGLGIAINICLGITLISNFYRNEVFLASLLMLAFSPIIIAGLIEDITHNVRPRTRLLSALISALATLIVTQAYIMRIDIAIIDALFKIPGLSWVVTILVIVGFLNSINIIDGFNGVASGSSLIMAFTICVIAYIVDDFLVFRLSLLISVPIVGFMLWNWPLGKIFLGDCGAYLLGIWIVVLGILLQFRSSNISPLAPVLIGAYPMIETLFTIYRRKFLKGNPVSRPDALHLHTLIYRRLIRKSELMSNSTKVVNSNSKVAVYIWLFILTDCILSVLFFENTNALLLFIILNLLLYARFYSMIVKFKTPKIMIS